MSETVNIKVLVFGPLVDITGSSELKIAAVNSTDNLLVKLSELFPEINQIDYRMAVNKMIIQENTDLNNNDIVALLPPFSGG